jgi:hypothetical protein
VTFSRLEASLVSNTRSSKAAGRASMSENAAPALDPNDSNAYLVYIPSAVFVVLCPLLMALRIWARLRRGGKLGVDDWTAIAALVSGSSRRACFVQS